MGFRIHRTNKTNNVSLTRSKLSQIIQIDCCLYGTVRCVFINTRSGRVVRNTPRYDQSVDQRNQGLVAWEIMIDQDDREDVPTAASQYAIQKAQDNPMAFAAIGNPDILYWDQAMKAPDRDKFIEAVGAELEGHERMGNFEPIPLDQVPTGTKLIDMVWSMRRKRRINTQEVYKWKLLLNVHGGQQVHGVHFWDTYAPVVTWQTIRLFLILSLILGWQSRQLDFVMAYCKRLQKCHCICACHKVINAKAYRGRRMHSSCCAMYTDKSSPVEFGIATWIKECAKLVSSPAHSIHAFTTGGL